MRMDPTSGPSAADLLATMSEAEIKDILRTYGEERMAGPIARAVVRERARRPLVRTHQLSEVVARAAGPAARRYRIHPATRTFQALRIAVNREVEGLERLVADAVSLLRRGGRLAAISFHSLEDRAVKTSLRAMAERCVCPPGLPVCGCGREDLVRILTPRPVMPSAEEVESNPRSRSARLRAAERL
jgi:16S rRNA (cytosine1402-N4)-methyltransferase